MANRTEYDKKYRESGKAKKDQEKYRGSIKYKEAQKRFYHSIAGRAKHLLAGIKRRSSLTSKECDLTLEWLEEKLQNGYCEVSGILFKMDTRGNKHASFYSPSVDRIDNSRGYTIDNCRMVLHAFNLCKGTGTDKDVSVLINALKENGF